MILDQEHIINKVFLEVETNSTKVAHDLKDHLGMFLKQDILPYLEDYFKTIEQKLPAEIVQIPQLTLEIHVNSQDHYKTLKTDTKEKLVQKIDALLKSSSKTTEKVVLINTHEHQTRSLLFFIENGYTPWWKTSDNSIHFTQEEIKEIASSKSFSSQYIQLLQKPICKKRCIQQFTDQELHTMLTSAFKHTKEIAILQNDVIKSLTQLSVISRDFIWSEIITYLQSKNITVCLEKVSSVLIKSVSFQGENVYAFAKAVLTLIQQALKITKTNTIDVLQKEGIYTFQNKEILVSRLLTVFDTIGLSKEATSILQPVIKTSTSQFIKSKELKEEEQVNPEKTIANKDTSKPIKQNFSNAENQEIKLPNKDKNIDQTIAESEEKQKNKNITSFDEKDSSMQGHITPIKNKKGVTQKTILKSDAINSDTTVSKESIEKNEKGKIHTNFSNEEDRSDNQNSPKEIKNDTVKDHNILISKNNVQQQYKEFKTQLDQRSENNVSIDTHIKKITSQQEEVFISNTGSYHVPNAGLIILHPYLKPFFQNCKIIDDTNTIINPEMAVHALHYLATRKEQQLESQLLFEKFLCGIPLKKPIQRQVQLSDTIKQQAEELLESVVENWGVLNNASPDLLRHEFLQRAGKLSFKEDNPKIVIERKTQDILVDKIPWGIGICRLPWLDHLVYTNW